ncbi:MAG: crossover junction endodeoxyribonuclease RuvC [Candidatus Acidulodesulfobacterium ferriphilum]|uniref:Crossover junction endodeoxyribonuclease RuvC n=1 Tax=Candidatus Acidulodesulfobacterium ferriphilum TaxID=2597223 RepID=A0A519BC46_9DELT|nr:MAG: crossover junction endodeoxyribonuclease RuvC [Candidatus Acidulodesulfobacterium ferriphilum]
MRTLIYKKRRLNFSFMSYRILGVDPGSRLTGWAVLDLPSFGRTFNLISCGLIDAKNKEFPSNLGKIYEELREVMKEYSPGIMSLESVFSGVNPASLIKLSQARGVICLLSSVFNIKLKEYSPRFVKKSIAGYGDANKQQMKEALNIICASKSSNIKAFLNDNMDSNISDALAIAVCCATDMSNFIYS